MNADYYPDSESERILKIGHTVQKLWLFFENPLMIAQRPCQGGAIFYFRFVRSAISLLFFIESRSNLV